MHKILKLFSNAEDGNLAFHVGDNEHNVITNHKALAKKHGYDYEELRHMNQVHGNHIEVITSSSLKLIKECDAMITNEKNLPLMVMVADCIPILMYDLTQGVIAVVHAGRNSTFLNIASLTAQRMMDEFACEAKNISVEMGPSIQKCCYEVSPEMAQIVKTSFGSEFVDGRLINLQGINEKQLQNLGIFDIKVDKTCTKCSNRPYFSYRLNNETGRFSGILMLK